MPENPVAKTELLPAPPAGLAPRPVYMPLMTIEEAKARRDQFIAFVKACLVEGVDYGVVPGSDKNVLLKPGTEKLCTLFGLSPTFELIEHIEDWTGKDHNGELFFYYFYKCRLWRQMPQPDGTMRDVMIAEGDGSCNSMESKYRYRWVPKHQIPAGLDPTKLKTRGGKRSEFTFAIEKSETTGQYAKPAEYWKEFNDAINNGSATRIKKTTRQGKEMDAWEIDATLYRVPNEDIPDQVNTIQKMSQKRAMNGPTLTATNASEYFTQDIEDLEEIAAEHPARPAPAVATPAQPSTEEEARTQASLLFNEVKTMCEVTREALTKHLQHYLCATDLKAVDTFSIVTKLNQVKDREKQEAGAGQRWVLETTKIMDAKPAEPPAEEPTAADKKRAAKKPPAGATASLTTVYAKVAKRIGNHDGMALLNAYLDKQFGTHAVPNLHPGDDHYEEIAKVLEAMNGMPVPELRKFLVPGPVAEPMQGITDADVPL